MIRKSNLLNILFCIVFLSISCMALAEGTDRKGEISWVKSTDVKFDGEIGFSQDTMGTMNDLIAKYKRGEKGVKIYATGKIVDKNGKVLAVFNGTPAKIISISNSEYYQFDEGPWRFRSSMNQFEKYRKVFHREN